MGDFEKLTFYQLKFKWLFHFSSLKGPPEYFHFSDIEEDNMIMIISKQADQKIHNISFNFFINIPKKYVGCWV